MRVVDLGSRPGRVEQRFDSAGLTVALLARAGEKHMVTMQLEPGGVVGRHPAACEQLLLVLDGDAVVSGADGACVVLTPGQAAVWSAGEEHETRSQAGMLALVVEGDLRLQA